MTERLPFWRSLLFVPANVPRFIEKAPQVGADGRVVHECVTNEAEAHAFFSPDARDERGLELQ